MANRYLNVEARLEQQKRETRERTMRAWLAEIETSLDPGFCYFAAAEDGPIKIGSSRQPNRRVYDLRRDTPGLKLLARATGGAERESYYHRLFEEHCVGGEWFERHPDILAEIERLSG